jgi:3-phenylpropionate/trans-cinnamate dioxygenase ferredoxin subunit
MSADDSFEDVGSVQQIPNGGIRLVEVGGEDVLLSRFGESVHAVGGNCTHAFSSLGDGKVRGKTVTCAAHGASFDLTTGRAMGGSCPNLPVYSVRLEGMRVLVGRR